MGLIDAFEFGSERVEVALCPTLSDVVLGLLAVGFKLNFGIVLIVFRHGRYQMPGFFARIENEWHVAL